MNRLLVKIGTVIVAGLGMLSLIFRNKQLKSENKNLEVKVEEVEKKADISGKAAENYANKPENRNDLADRLRRGDF